MRAFSWTLVAFCVATCLLWLNRTWLLDIWASPALDVAARAGADLHFPDQTRLVVVSLKLTVTTALLLTFPVFSAEAWLLLCQVTRREQARRLTLPFSATSTGAILLALWLALQVDFSVIVEFV